MRHIADHLWMASSLNSMDGVFMQGSIIGGRGPQTVSGGLMNGGINRLGVTGSVISLANVLAAYIPWTLSLLI